MYRILRQDAIGGRVHDRRRQASHPPLAIPEPVADGPCRVWAYDATAFRGPLRGIWYRLFVMFDLFSRFCPGWMVVPHKRGDLVADWIARVVAVNGAIPDGTLTVRADRGSPMTSKPVTQLLADLRIGRTHSLTLVSNDNAYSEAAFKALKYAPDFPRSFGSIEDAPGLCGLLHRLMQSRASPLGHRVHRDPGPRAARPRPRRPPTPPVPSESSTGDPSRRSWPGPA